MATDLKVELIPPGNRAIVSTEGFCRVVVKSTGELHEELVELAEAHLLVASNYGFGSSFQLEAIDYATGEPLKFDNGGLSDQPRRRISQLLDAPRISSSRKPRRGFCLGRLARSR